MKYTQINTGILSFGMSGRVFHAPFISTNPHFNLSAVVERSKKAAHEFYPGIISYDTMADLLADDTIELVIVNTPNYTHFQYAKEALEAGKHVLIEKPAVDDSAQFDALLAISKQQGKQLFFYQNRRYDSHFLDLKKVIESGELGKLIEVHFRFDRYKWNWDKNTSRKIRSIFPMVLPMTSVLTFSIRQSPFLESRLNSARRRLLTDQIQKLQTTFTIISTIQLN